MSIAEKTWFAVFRDWVAFPVKYESSGVMTFIVNQEGKVYQKDLGEKTGEIAWHMQEFNPDQGWTEAVTEREAKRFLLRIAAGGFDGGASGREACMLRVARRRGGSGGRGDAGGGVRGAVWVGDISGGGGDQFELRIRRARDR